jgi:hypothetical protein
LVATAFVGAGAAALADAGTAAASALPAIDLAPRERLSLDFD